MIDDKIFYTTSTQEYSLNNQTSWTGCSASTTLVTFTTGNKVWVREIVDHAKLWYLGEVKAVSGRPDLFPSERIALFITIPVPGMSLIPLSQIRLCESTAR